MAKEIEAVSPLSGGTAYYVLREQVTKLPWDTTIPGLAPASPGWVDASYANYANPMTEQGHSAVYLGDVPAALPAGKYNAVVRMQQGGTPAEGDPAFWSYDFSWNGTQIVDQEDLYTQLQGIVTTLGGEATATALAALATAVTEIAGDTDTLLTGQGLQATATGLATVKTELDGVVTTQALQATATALSSLQTDVTEIATDTDSLLTGQAGLATASSVAALATAVVTMLSDLTSIMTSLSTDLGDQATLASAIAAVKAVTDQLAFSGGFVKSVQQGFVQIDPGQDWSTGTVTRGTTREILRVLRAWARGRSSASTDLLTRDFYDYSDTDVLFQNIYDNVDNPTARNTAGT